MELKDLPKKYQKQAKEALRKQELAQGNSKNSSSYDEKVTLALVNGRRNKQSKYKARKVVLDGTTFDSVLEANYYSQLKIREKAGEISDLLLQPRFLLQEGFECNGKKVQKIEYVGDFEFTENGQRVVVDTKGCKTKEYMLKKKLFLYKYGNDIRFDEVSEI